MKHILVILIVVATCCNATAQLGHRGEANVTLTGSTVNAVGKRIELYSYTDMLTMQEHLEDAAVVDSLGGFALSCYTNYPRIVYVQIETYTQSFFIEPGRDYNIYIPEFDWSTDERQNIHLAPVALPLEFLDLPPDELNVRIGAFEQLVDSFVVANKYRMDARYKPDRRCFDTLTTLVAAQCGRGGDDFFSRYVNYSMAQLKYTMRLTSRGKAAKELIESGDVRYYDEQYMRLFTALFADCISHGTRRIPLERLTAWVQNGDIDTYMDSIGLDPLLRNEQVRELAALVALHESYYMSCYDRQGVRTMVARLGERSRFDDHRILAANLLHTMERTDGEAEMPPVMLPDAEHNMMSLDSLRGKWVYMAFIRTGDPHSLAETETMAHFRDSIYAHYNDVEFVTICCDREFQKMYHLLKNSRRGHRYNWTWLHFDGQYSLLEHYGVMSYPTFVLLDPEGRQYYELTPAPASGFLMHGPWQKPVEEPQEQDILFR